MQSENDIGFQLRTLANLIHRDVEKNRVITKDDLPHRIQGWVINYLYENKDTDIFQKDIEQKFSIRRSTTSNMLKVMEEKGLIIRESVESDARLKKLVLTDKAIEIHNKIMTEIEAREKKLKNGLTQEEINSFFTIIKKLKANMEEKND